MDTTKDRIVLMAEAPDSAMMHEALGELRHGVWRVTEVAGDDAGPFRVVLRQERAGDPALADPGHRVVTTERWE